MPKRNSWDDLLFEGAKIERAVLKSAFFVLLLLIAPLLFFSFFPKYNVCFLDSPLYYFWPPNFEHAHELFSNNTDRPDSCLMLNISSISSVFFQLWLSWRIYFDFRWGDYKFNRIALLVSIIGVIALYFSSTASFVEVNSIFDPSPSHAIKNISIYVGFIAGFYVCLGEILVCLIRVVSGRLT